MKSWNLAKSLGTAIVTGLLVSVALTNPSESEYQEYATKRLTDYLEQEACPQAPKVWGKSLKQECQKLIDSNQSEIRKIIANSTEHHNFILFSIYKTDLSISKIAPFLPATLLPSYQFGTLALGKQFYTYQSERI